MQERLSLWETIWKDRSQIKKCPFNLIKLNHLNSPHARHVNTVGDHLKKPQSNWKLPFQFDQIEPFEQPSRIHESFEKARVKLKIAVSIWSIWSNWTIWTALTQDTLTLWETIWKLPFQFDQFDQIERFEQPSCKSVYHCGRPFEKTGVKLKNALSIWSNWTIWTALMQDTLTLWETIWKSPSQIENCFFNLIKLNHLNSPHARHINTVGDHLKKPESNWKLPFQFDQIELFEQPPHARAFITVGDHLKRPESIWKDPSQIENCHFNLIKLNHLNSPHARHVNTVGDHLKRPESNWKLPFQFDQFDQIEPFEQPSCNSIYHCGRPFEKTRVKLKIAVSIWSIWSNWTIWTALTQDTLTLWETIWKSPSQIENCFFNLIKLNHLNSPHARHINTVGDHLKKPESNWKLPFQFDQIELFEQPSRKTH